jgi:hypothetical protein
MKLPFSANQFFEIFENYNLAVFPMQIVLMLLAIAAVVISRRKRFNNGRIVLPILGALWLWMGIVYHWIFFSSINPLAYGFGAAFVLQGILFFVLRFTRVQSFAFHNDAKGAVAVVLIAYALVVYPVIGFFSSHSYPLQPTFGLPCPTTIFTFGMLLVAAPKLPWYFVLVPVLWSVIGFSAAFQFGVYEDIALIVSAAVFCIVNFLPVANRAAKPAAHSNSSSSTTQPLHNS